MTIDLEVLRIILDSTISATQAQMNQRLLEVERQRDEAVTKCQELSARLREAKFGTDKPSEPSNQDADGWRRYCVRNMRDEEIQYEGRSWRVMTHLREGLWRIIPVDGGAVEDSVRLDWNGVPVVIETDDRSS